MVYNYSIIKTEEFYFNKLILYKYTMFIFNNLYVMLI